MTEEILQLECVHCGHVQMVDPEEMKFWLRRRIKRNPTDTEWKTRYTCPDCCQDIIAICTVVCRGMLNKIPEEAKNESNPTT